MSVSLPVYWLYNIFRCTLYACNEIIQFVDANEQVRLPNLSFCTLNVDLIIFLLQFYSFKNHLYTIKIIITFNYSIDHNKIKSIILLKLLILFFKLIIKARSNILVEKLVGVCNVFLWKMGSLNEKKLRFVFVSCVTKSTIQ